MVVGGMIRVGGRKQKLKQAVRSGVTMTTGVKIGIGLGVTALLVTVVYFGFIKKAEEVVEAVDKTTPVPQSDVVVSKPTPTAGGGKGVQAGVSTAGGGKGMDGDLSLAGDVWGS